MPMLKLTRKAIEGLPDVSKDDRFVIYRDTELKGFALRHTSNGLKTFCVLYRPNGGGRAVRETSTPIGRFGVFTVEKAREHAKQTLARIALGADPSAEKADRRQASTLEDLMTKYMTEEAKPKTKPNTSTNYDRYCRIHINPEIGKKKARDVTRADVAKLHRKIGETNAPTANRVKTFLGGVFSWAMKAGELPENFKNPARDIEAFRESARERFLTSAELARLGEALREAETAGLQWDGDETKPKAKHLPKAENRRVVVSPFATAAIRLLLLTGCRLREILNLQWSEVDLERGLLLLGDSKTGKKTVLLNAPAMAVLASLPRLGSIVCPGNDPNAPRHDLQRPWAAITKRAGLEGVRLHDLRHSFASVGAMSGLGLPVIGKLLGHTQTATTERYAHLADEAARRATESIAATIAASLGEAEHTADVIPIGSARR